MQAKWTGAILDEVFDNLTTNRPDLDAVKLSLTAFVRAQIDLDRDVVYAAVTRIADSWRNPPGAVADVIARLERDGLLETAAALRG